MGLTDEVRRAAREVAGDAHFVSIDLERVAELEPGPPPELDAERHYLDGSPEDVADYLLTLDAINFGSGWFPTLRKRPGSLGTPTRQIDTALWNRGQAPRYKSVPRHRTRTVYY